MITKVRLADGGEAMVDWVWRRSEDWYVDIVSIDDAPPADAGLADEVTRQIEMICADDYPLAAYLTDRASV